MPNLAAETLRDFAVDLLWTGGFTLSDAEATADLLVWANLRGVDSHGVLRIPRYIEMVRRGQTVSGGRIETVRSFGATALLDGGKCPGAVGMNAAADTAVALAQTHGVGWCVTRAISHAGAVGYFTSRVAQQGLIGLAFTASKPLMSYHGAKGQAVSTNPLSIAIPRAGHPPIVLDMSTSASALGKIMAARDAGEPIPEGCAMDADGCVTTDPHAVAALLPMAGPKGSGLSLMIEYLTSVLAGNAVIAPVLGGLKTGGNNGTVIAILPEAFGAGDAFAADVNHLAEAIGALEPAQGNSAVRLPGERGHMTERHRKTSDIPIAAGTWRRLVALALELSVSLP